MGGEESKLLYDQLLAGLRKGYKEDKVQTGVFGAMMQVGASDSPPSNMDHQVELINDGPVTLELEAMPPSQKSDAKDKQPAASAVCESASS